jgi:hypothetical protein
LKVKDERFFIITERLVSVNVLSSGKMLQRRERGAGERPS